LSPGRPRVFIIGAQYLQQKVAACVVEEGDTVHSLNMAEDENFDTWKARWKKRSERAPKEAFTAHNSGTYTNGEAAQAEGCDFETTIEDDGSSDVIISLWDSDESDSDYIEGLNEVHAINMVQKSNQKNKSDKKKARLKKKTVEEKRQQQKSLESTPRDEPTSDSDGKRAHIEKMVTTWQTARNAHGETCKLCDSRVQDPECAGHLCYACCDSTRVENYKCG